MQNDFIQQIWPQWTPVEQLGKGSFGVVYKAVRNDNNIFSTSAIKVISIPQDRSEVEELYSEGLTEEETKTYLRGVVDDFISEVSLMDTFKGMPNIVSIEDYAVVEKTDSLGWDILVRMELLTPFDRYIRDHVMDETEVIKLGIDICTALEICGRKNIIHRDIKPENIFVNEFGYYKLGDFGIAKKLENMGASHSQKGTFNYMAPEVANGTHYDARVDIYSLGVVLYRLLNKNCLPFINESNRLDPAARKNALEQRLNGVAFPNPVEASDAMANVILRACAFKPEDRFATAEDFKKALEEVRAGTYAIPLLAEVETKGQAREADVLEQTVSLRNEKTHKTSSSQAEASLESEKSENKTTSIKLKKNPSKPETDPNATVAIHNRKGAERPDAAATSEKASEKNKTRNNGKKWIPAFLTVLVGAIALVVLFLVLNGKQGSGNTTAENPLEESFDNSTATENVRLISVEIKKLPTKLQYTVGQSVDLSGLEVLATYSDGSTKLITEGFETLAGEFTSAGENEIVISYGGVTQQFIVNVADLEGQTSEPSQSASDDIVIGDVISFGPYEWLILDKDGPNVLIITKEAIAGKPYDEERYGTCSWELCSLRKWLNESFINEFSMADQARIQIILQVQSNSNVEPDDRVFLLSATEAQRLFSGDDARKCIASETAKNEGVLASNNGECIWWLRANVPMVVSRQGKITQLGNSANSNGIGVRPAMWVTLDSSQASKPTEKSITVEKGESYTDKEHVALYIHLYGSLPPNYITKSQAEALGWESSKGNLAEVASGKSIGGDSFANREGKLPQKSGRQYYVCDIDYVSGPRNPKRIIYSNDGLIFYTEDNYGTFKQLY